MGNQTQGFVHVVKTLPTEIIPAIPFCCLTSLSPIKSPILLPNMLFASSPKFKDHLVKFKDQSSSLTALDSKATAECSLQFDNPFFHDA